MLYTTNINTKPIIAYSSPLEALVKSSPLVDNICVKATKKDGKIILEELLPEVFIKAYSGSTHLYSVEETTFEYDGKSYFSEDENIPFEKEIIINDKYDYFLKEQEKGTIEIKRYDKARDNSDLTNENIDNLILTHPELAKKYNYTNEQILTLYTKFAEEKPIVFRQITLNMINQLPELREQIVNIYTSHLNTASNNLIKINGATAVPEEITAKLQEIYKLMKIDNPEQLTLNGFSNIADLKCNKEITNESNYLTINICLRNDDLTPLYESLTRRIILNNYPETPRWLVDGLTTVINKDYENNEAEFRNMFSDKIIRRDKHIPSEQELNVGNNPEVGYLITKFLVNQFGIQKIFTLLKDKSYLKDLTDRNFIDSIIQKYKEQYPMIEDLNEVKTPQDIMDWMNKNILYGYIDKEGSIHQDTLKGYSEKGQVFPLEEIKEKKIGTCIEQAKLIDEQLKKLGYDTNIYLMHPEKNYKDHLHCVVIGQDKKTGEYIYFEHSSTAKRGIYKANSYEEILQIVNPINRAMTILPNIPDRCSPEEFSEYARKQDNPEYIRK